MATKNSFPGPHTPVLCPLRSLRLPYLYFFSDYFTTAVKTENGVTVLLIENGPGFLLFYLSFTHTGIHNCDDVFFSLSFLVASGKVLRIFFVYCSFMPHACISLLTPGISVRRLKTQVLLSDSIFMSDFSFWFFAMFTLFVTHNLGLDCE